MKKTFLMLILGLKLSIFSCKKDAPPVVEWGECSMFFNNVQSDWKIFASHNYPYLQGFDITISAYNNQNEKRKELYFNKILFAKDTFYLQKSDSHSIDFVTGASYGTILADGDVLGASYELDMQNPKDNYLIVDERTASTNEVRGKFQVSFFKTDSNGDADAPNTVHLNGTFHTKIIN